MRSSLAHTAAASARAVRALAEDEALVPGRLINYALHALGPLDEVRARWETANGTPAPNPPPPTPVPDGPPPARVHVALARSTPRPVPPASVRPGSAPAPSASKPPSRGHI